MPEKTTVSNKKKPSPNSLKARALGHASQPEMLLSSLLNAVYWVDESLQSRLQALGWPSISHAKSMIMIHVFNGITRPSDLAKKMGVSRQAIHKTLQEMVADGLLVILPDAKDKRAKVVAYNNDSINIMSDAFDALLKIEQDLADRVGRENLDQMRRILEKDWGPISTA